MKAAEILFWIFAIIVFYTYIGYGLILYVLVKIKEHFAPLKTIIDSGEILPDVTLLIAAYNEEGIISSKMINCDQLDYPSEKLKIVWVTDGSNDRTNVLLSEYNNVTLLFEPIRKGKTSALNRAMQYVSSPIVIFTDANTMLNKEAVKEIVKAFSNSAVGCVAGEKRIVQKNMESASVGGEGIYWKYESTLKALDSRLKTAIGAVGELFAIRRNLFEEMEADTLLDDFICRCEQHKKGTRLIIAVMHMLWRMVRSIWLRRKKEK